MPPRGTWKLGVQPIRTVAATLATVLAARITPDILTAAAADAPINLTALIIPITIYMWPDIRPQIRPGIRPLALHFGVDFVRLLDRCLRLEGVSCADGLLQSFRLSPEVDRPESSRYTVEFESELFVEVFF